MSIDYTGIKHAYIGATNLKKIYQGSTLQWEEPSSEPVTVWRAVRTTMDDNPSYNDEYVLVLRPSSGTFSGQYLPVNSYESSIRVMGSRVYFISLDSAKPLTLKYNYNAVGSDGLRLCHYAEIEDADNYYSFKVTALKSGNERYMRLRKKNEGDNSWLRSTTGPMSLEIIDLDSAGNSGWFSRQVVSGRYESGVPDSPNIDWSWASPTTDMYTSNNINYYVYGNFGTYSSNKYVTYGSSSSGYGYCYLFKKVTVYL